METNPSFKDTHEATELARIKALKDYQILDTSEERAFDDLALLASSIGHTPIAVLSLADENRLWFKARFGLERPELPRSRCFCNEVILTHEPLIIPDALRVPGYAQAPLMNASLPIHSYAGFPLITPDGHAIGTLAIMDHVARAWSEQQMQGLGALARQAMNLLEQRRQNLNLAEAQRQIRLTQAKRRLLEVTLRESEQQYRSTFDLVGVGICHLDLQGTWIRVNDKYCELLGYEQEELMVLSLRDVVHPDDAQRDHEVLEEFKRGTLDFYQTDKRYVRKDGSIMWATLTARPFKDDLGIPRYAIAVIQDISARKAAEEALVKSEARIRWMFNNAAVGIVITDSLLQILDCNVTLARMLGYESGEISRIHLAQITHSEDWAMTQRILRALQAGAMSTTQVETRYLRKDGQVIWARTTLSLGHDHVQSDPQCLVIIEDITARKEAERKIAEHQTKLVAASKMSALGEMSGAIAHEINNPLTIIHGKALQIQRYVAQNRDVAARAIETSARQIETTALRISKIVKSLRSFSRDAENDPFVVTSVRSIVDETLDFCRERLKNHGVTLTISSFSDSTQIECRPVQISQVLLNLLNNAHDAAEVLAEKWIRLSVADLGEAVEVDVTDSGRGIPPEVAEKLMQPFFTTKEIGKGTGLGLSVSQGIVASHRGSLRLDGKAPNTRFVIQLPKRQPRQAHLRQRD